MTPCALANRHLLTAEHYRSCGWRGQMLAELDAALSIIKWRGKAHQAAEAKRLLAVLEARA